MFKVAKCLLMYLQGENVKHQVYSEIYMMLDDKSVCTLLTWVLDLCGAAFFSGFFGRCGCGQ